MNNTLMIKDINGRIYQPNNNQDNYFWLIIILIIVITFILKYLI